MCSLYFILWITRVTFIASWFMINNSYRLFSYIPALCIFSGSLILFNILDVFRNFALLGLYKIYFIESNFFIDKFRVFLIKGSIINFYQLFFNIIFYINKFIGYMVYLRCKSKNVATKATVIYI